MSQENSSQPESPKPLFANAPDSSQVRFPAFAKGVDGLLPAIAQCTETKRVLMVAWMNAIAFEETLRTGMATYFSRSRNRLWRKGEESGHRQSVVNVFVDCDEDTILLEVRQVGAACHEGYATCFFRRYRSAEELEIIEPRLLDPKQIYAQSDKPSK